MNKYLLFLQKIGRENCGSPITFIRIPLSNYMLSVYHNLFNVNVYYGIEKYRVVDNLYKLAISRVWIS